MTLKQQYFNIRLYTTFSQLKCLFLEPKCLTTIYVCFADTHSLDHMFLHCSSVAAFWKTFQNWWTNKTKQQLTLSNSMILYGVFDKTEHRYSLNYVLLIAKFTIYCSCLHDEKFSFDSFLILILNKKLNIQKKI